MTAAVIDPLAPAPHGLWSTHGVRVRRRRGLHRRHTRSDSFCAQLFCAIRHGELLTVEHDIEPDELCDDLAVMLTEQLAVRGAPLGLEVEVDRRGGELVAAARTFARAYAVFTAGGNFSLTATNTNTVITTADGSASGRPSASNWRTNCRAGCDWRSRSGLMKPPGISSAS